MLGLFYTNAETEAIFQLCIKLSPESLEQVGFVDVKDLPVLAGNHVFVPHYAVQDFFGLFLEDSLPVVVAGMVGVAVVQRVFLGFVVVYALQDEEFWV